MFLFQLLIPLTIGRREAGARKVLTQIERELTDKFGGVTAYTQSPAEGLWKKSRATTPDTVVSVEVITEKKSLRWWKSYRKELEARLKQDEILIRYHAVEKV